MSTYATYAKIVYVTIRTYDSENRIYVIRMLELLVLSQVYNAVRYRDTYTQ